MLPDHRPSRSAASLFQMLRFSALCIVLATALLGGCIDREEGPRSGASTALPSVSVEHEGERIRAVTLDARERPDSSLLVHLRDLGVTHVALVPFAFQPSHDVPRLRMHTESRWYSEGDDGIREMARRAGRLGMEIILKPHIWIGDYDSEGQARHHVGFDSEKDWQQWEDQYRQFIMHYARLSQEIDAPLLVIGTELAHAAQTRPSFWRGLIQKVRSVYDGKLTYAANWYQAYQKVSFWDALDYIGVQAYFPISEAADPTRATLHEGWRTHAGELARLAERTNRPVLFTELGYRSVPYAAATPWRWPSRGEEDTTAAAPGLQARLYRAFFTSVWTQPWMAGAILWKWHPRAHDPHPLGFSPQGKPAEEVIREGFGGTPARESAE